MPNVTPVFRRRLALAVWAAALLLFLLMGVWNVNADRQEAENRLSSEAGRTAAQLAALLSLPAWELDELAARTIVMAAMADESIYAVKVQTNKGLLEGQRRNYQWEPVPWDDEIAENSVQGMNPLKMEGRPVGSVEVYLSPRITDEDLAQKARREVLRFCVAALLSTLALLALLWQWGDLARLLALLPWHGARAMPEAGARQPVEAGSAPAPEMDANARQAAAVDAPASSPLREDIAAGAVVSADLGRAFLLRRPEAWRVTAGLFAQTFAQAPALLLRLFEDEDAENLCRLGGILEKAAPSVGAERLGSAAQAMQWAVTGADRAAAATAVESCALALREVLEALDGARRGKASGSLEQQGER